MISKERHIICVNMYIYFSIHIFTFTNVDSRSRFPGTNVTVPAAVVVSPEGESLAMFVI